MVPSSTVLTWGTGGMRSRGRGQVDIIWRFLGVGIDVRVLYDLD